MYARVSHRESLEDTAPAAPLTAPITFRRAGRMSIGRDQLLNLVEMTYEPLVLVATLWGTVVAIGGRLGPQHIILAVIVFSLTFPGAARLSQVPWRAVRNILMGWIALAGLLLLFGYASGYLGYFDLRVLVAWWWVAPVSLVGGHLLLRVAAPALRELEGGPRRAVVAGMNAQGVELARRLAADTYSNVRVAGFFDDRANERTETVTDFSMLGKLSELAEYVKRNQVDMIYLSLPMASQQRILTLLDALRDTTASIYFVPDIFVTDLIQGRVDSVRGMPVVGVCDSPFSGFDGLIKRASDIVISLLILVHDISAAAADRPGGEVSSRGPVIFKQRRYGLNGEEIFVYKFRSMTGDVRMATDPASHPERRSGDRPWPSSCARPPWTNCRNSSTSCRGA